EEVLLLEADVAMEQRPELSARLLRGVACHELAQPRVVTEGPRDAGLLAGSLERRQQRSLLPLEVRLELGGEGRSEARPRFEHGGVVSFGGPLGAASDDERRVVVAAQVGELGATLHRSSSLRAAPSV